MKFSGKLLRVVAVGVLTAVIGLAASPVLADVPHEDPAEAKTAFSGVALFDYYAATIDLVIRSQDDDVAVRMDRMPVANVPASIQNATNDFADDAKIISRSVVSIDSGRQKLHALLSESRFEEAVSLIDELTTAIDNALVVVDRLEELAIFCGDAFGVQKAPTTGSLRKAYDNLLAQIDKLRDLLKLDLELLLGTPGIPSPVTALTLQTGGSGYTTPPTIILTGDGNGATATADVENGVVIALTLTSGGSGYTTSPTITISGGGGTGATATASLGDYRTRLAEGKLLNTILSLAVRPTTVFVGDSVAVEGVLKAGDAPLAAREVDILIDSHRSIAVTTDSEGHYAGELPIPYQYIPQMQVQALYRPQGQDVGIYMASLSDPVDVKIQFYKAVITFELDQAYPGRETQVRGRLDYGTLLPDSLRARKLEIALDNIAVAETTGTTSFSAAISLPPSLELGDHVITVSAADDQRYAPSFADAQLDVVKVLPVFTGAVPGLVVIPGTFSVSGQVYSDFGPLVQSRTTVSLANKQVSVLTGDDGAFKLDYQTRMGLGLIGSEVLVMHVTPQEPWNAEMDITRKVMVINVVNCGLFLVILVVVGRVASRRLSSLRRRSRKEAPLRGTAPVVAPPLPVYTTSLGKAAGNPDTVNETPDLAPRDKTLFLYRMLVKLAQRVASVVLRPQQTLREFAAQTAPALGPLSGWFLELTRIVEKILYSQHRGTLQDAEQGEQLAHKINEGLK